MGIGVAKRGSAAGGLWRRLTCIAVAYVLVIQTIFIAFVGAQSTASAADEGAPIFELCLNEPHDGPPSPVDVPGHQGYTHCVFCFASAFQSLAAPPQSAFHRLRIEIAAIWSPVDDWRPPTFDQRSKVQARGPPLGA
jgi:hypothetical protein